MNHRQELFVKEFGKDLNAAAAARRAGYAAHSSDRMGYALLRIPEIRDAVQENLRMAMAQCEVTAERVIREIAIVAFANISDVASWSQDGLEFKPKEDLPRDVTATIKRARSTSSATEAGVTIRNEIEMHDKLRALEMLGRYLSLFKDTLDVTHRVVETVPMTTQQAREWARVRAIEGEADDDL